MSEELLDRMERAVEAVLARNRQLKHECQQLRQEQAAWRDEKAELLEDVERALKRLDGLQLEDL